MRFFTLLVGIVIGAWLALNFDTAQGMFLEYVDAILRWVHDVNASNSV